MSGSLVPSAIHFEISPTLSEGPIVGMVSRPPQAPASTDWILYLHGFGSSQQGEKAEFFRSRCLARGLTFVSFDFQGHGLSGGSIRDLTVARCLRDVERVRRHVEGLFDAPPVLMGSSMGGLVGLWHATAHEALAGVFVAPALGLDERFPQLIGAEGMQRWKESGLLPITNELGTFELGWGFVEDLRSRRPEELQQRHSLPTIIFQGKQDDRVSWEMVERFADGTSAETRLVLFNDGDHRLLSEKEIIWSETVGFWRELGFAAGDETQKGEGPY